MITYSEIFYSIQGEGKFTGRPTLWLRLFACNLSCSGFGQLFPTRPETYELPFEDFDVSTVDRVEDLPVWKFGCDSSYSWAKKFKHLAHQDDADTIVQKIEALRPPNSGRNIHLCFTGGEPLLPLNQKAIVDILNAYQKTDHYTDLEDITIETNGTQKISESLITETPYHRFLFSVSPKLFTVSGEKNEKAIKPHVVREYTHYGDLQLKFVVGNNDDQWEELNRVVDQFRSEIKDPDIWIMPVGATEEAQNDIAGLVATHALKYGYSVSARVHCNLWGNQIGV